MHEKRIICSVISNSCLNVKIVTITDMDNLIIKFFVNAHIVTIIFVNGFTFTTILIDILVYCLRNHLFN